MESRPSEERLFRLSPSSTPRPPLSSTGFLASQAMKDQIHPKPSLEELHRELYEEKIKEEIIARRLAQRRMIEEQVRREIELEMMVDTLNGGRFHVPMTEPLMMMRLEERFGPHLGPTKVEFEERFGLHFGHREVEFGRRFGPHEVQREVKNEERLTPHDISKLEMPPLNPVKSEIKPVNMPNFSNEKLSGVKRKAANISGNINLKYPKPAHKDWSCALCQVSATSEEGLKKHLKGKKHLEKTAELLSVKKSAEPNSSKQKLTSSKKKGNPVGKKVFIEVDRNVREVTERGIFLSCALCRIECPSKDHMAQHLSGRKHRIRECSSSLKMQQSAKRETPEETVGVVLEKPKVSKSVVI